MSKKQTHNDLFAQQDEETQENAHTLSPLAERMRPQNFDDMAGQEHLLHAQNGQLFAGLQAQGAHSMILWGPPGCGKTTLANIIGRNDDAYFQQISAIFSGVSALKDIFDFAKKRALQGTRTVLFVDEIHRFNKAQQDAFLPVLESGTIILIGATTENPSFALNNALLSRCRVYSLERLSIDALNDILTRIETQHGHKLPLTDDARNQLVSWADGDARSLLNMAETLLKHSANSGAQEIDLKLLSQIIQKRALQYDRSADEHYNLISALHKSVRGSDPDAALYWMCRMLEGGEDPRYIARRMIRMASEDIGLASPQALQLCISAAESYERLGSPEGELALAQALIYLVTAPKSNAVYTAYKKARDSARKNGSLKPPAHILNAPTNLMKEQGYGQGYEYDHDCAQGISGQSYFPKAMKGEEYYHPKPQGVEKDISERLKHARAIRAQRLESDHDV
jgi:putative ATPase